MKYGRVGIRSRAFQCARICAKPRNALWRAGHGHRLCFPFQCRRRSCHPYAGHHGRTALTLGDARRRRSWRRTQGRIQFQKPLYGFTFGASEFTAAGPRDRASVVSLPAKTVQITRRSRDFACTVKCPLLSASDDARAMRGHFINRIKTSRNDLTTVIPKPNEPVEVALRRFRRAIQNNGLIAELRARTAYEKPTTERKRKKAAAVARLRKQIRRAMPPRKLY